MSFQKQTPAPKATPLQKGASKTDVKETKDDIEVVSTPKSTKAPAKRKLAEKVDTAAVSPSAKPDEVARDKPNCKIFSIFLIDVN